MSQIKHGEAGNYRSGRPASYEYQVWASMIQRCENPNNPAYKDYGERGIRVCDRWRWSYPAFLADMGRAPKGFTIERADNEAGYYPDNCRWATMAEQAQNRRRNPRYKLTDDQVEAIRADLRNGIKQTTVAAKYGLHQAFVSRIASGQRHNRKRG